MYGFKVNLETVKVLGRGGFGNVILVKREFDKKLLAVKEIRLSQLSSSQIRYTENEVEILKDLDHPHIIRYEGGFKDDAHFRILMEYCNSGDLSEKIKAQKGEIFEEMLILDWFTQICSALEYCHTRNIIHRDIKPSNIFLHMDKSQIKLKLGDFGISKALENTLAEAKTNVGTLIYFSPEICNDQSYNTATDIWSLGLIMYELCTLKHAFKPEGFLQIMLKITEAKYEPIQEEYSDDIKSIVTDCLQKDPEDRPTADMLLNRSCILPNFASNFGSLNKMRPLQPPRSWLGSQEDSTVILPKSEKIRQYPTPWPKFNTDEEASGSNTVQNITQTDFFGSRSRRSSTSSESEDTGNAENSVFYSENENEKKFSTGVRPPIPPRP